MNQDRLIIAAVGRGDFDAVRELCEKYDYRADSRPFFIAVIKNRLDICIYLYNLGKCASVQSVMLSLAIYYSTIHNNREMYEWVLNECHKHLDRIVLLFLYHSNRDEVDVLDALSKFGWIPSALDTITTVHYGATNMMRWLCERGCAIHCFPSDANPPKEMIRIAHEYNIDGQYREVCKEGICAMCKEIWVKDAWEMDEIEYENGIQWLPRELMEDMVQLLAI